MKILNSRLDEVEELAHEDGFYKSYLRIMEWPSLQYVREVLLSVRECNGLYVPTDILKDSEAGFRGFACSRGCEVSFQRLEDETRGHKAGRLGAVARWQRLVANGMLEDIPIAGHGSFFSIS